jgi:integrase/recombinase XerD
MSTWKATALKHKGEKRIAIYFNYNQELIARLRKLEDVRWSQTLKAWHLPDIEENRVRFKLEPAKSLTDIHHKKIANYRRWLDAKRYSQNTIKTYIEVLSTFLLYYHDKPVEELSNIDINNYNNDYILKNNLSSSYQNQFVNAVKLFFKVIEETKIDVELIFRPRRAKTLPNVLSKEEVKLILDATKNLKHKTMLSLIYACGLRSGELLNLLPEHVDSNRGVLIIKQAKGMKDRIAPLGAKLIEMLRFYFVTFKPKRYLFEGQTAGSAYDARSLQQVIKQSLGRTGITKNVTLHWLRHSYATHLLENGTDLRYIQEILGHRSSRTTEIYTHVSTKSIQKIVSPFDYL